MIRIAACGDVHYDRKSRPEMKEHFRSLEGRADVLLIAGDLTQSGAAEEGIALASDLGGVKVPVVAVLGNHDFHQGQEIEIRKALENVGVVPLEGENAVFRIRDFSLGVSGIKGFGGGFFDACVAEFGEREIKNFASHARKQADLLRRGLLSLQTDYRFALTHYAPIDATLLGEKKELYPFLGSYLLSEAIDAGRADAAFHGHAHKGVERGATPGGVPVRNVALNVIRHTYNIYSFERSRDRKPSVDVGDLS